MDLRELLSIPYLLEAEAVETEPGKWLLRLAYPELPGCTAEGFVVEDALEGAGASGGSKCIVEPGRGGPAAAGPAQAACSGSDPLWTATIWDCRLASWPCWKPQRQQILAS